MKVVRVIYSPRRKDNSRSRFGVFGFEVKTGEHQFSAKVQTHVAQAVLNSFGEYPLILGQICH